MQDNCQKRRQRRYSNLFATIKKMKKEQFGVEQYNKRYASSKEHEPRNVITSFVDKYLKKGQRCLDLGSGGGRHSEYIARKDIKVTAVDISPVGIEKTKEMLSNFSDSNIAVVANMQQLPFKDQSFDSLIANRVLDHNNNKGIEKTFSEIERVLKNNSMVFIAVASISQSLKENRTIIEKNKTGGITFVSQNDSMQNEIVHHHFSEQEIIKLARQYHFAILEIKESMKTDKKGEQKFEWQIIMKKVIKKK